MRLVLCVSHRQFWTNTIGDVAFQPAQAKSCCTRTKRLLTGAALTAANLVASSSAMLSPLKRGALLVIGRQPFGFLAVVDQRILAQQANWRVTEDLEKVEKMASLSIPVR